MFRSCRCCRKGVGELLFVPQNVYPPFDEHWKKDVDPNPKMYFQCHSFGS
jgi:hypothetical protein